VGLAMGDVGIFLDIRTILRQSGIYLMPFGIFLVIWYIFTILVWQHW
jgi:hypothetical protein